MAKLITNPLISIYLIDNPCELMSITISLVQIRAMDGL